MQRRLFLLLVAVLTGSLLAAACGKKGDDSPDPDANYNLRIEGQVLDWRSGNPVAGASVRTIGIAPERVTETDAEGLFTLEGIPAFGYVILDLAAVGYSRTLSPTILVEDEDLEDVVVEILDADDAGLFLGGYSVSTSAGHGHLLGRVLASNGEGVAGVSAVQVLPVTFEFDGPFFLDDADQPAPSRTETAAGGSFLFFNVEAGNIAVQGSAPGQVLNPVASVTKDAAWSLVTLGGRLPEGEATPTPFPTGTPGPQDFELDIVPIFQTRGCTADGCHNRVGSTPAAGTPPMDLLQQTAKIHEALVVDDPTRVVVADPDASLLLRKPLFDDPPDHLGGTIFQTIYDPDYQKIRRWIEDGAQP